ncbi:MAG: DUF2808 domain-containing protein [Thermosynechococcaceae cyanobacterium MS004]|nr:DUF2808 domain-containing protein [Thermosynechococcaceae cyanobacterium MS004]
MSASKSALKRLSSCLCIASCLFVGAPIVTPAQTNPGLTFTWGGNGPSGKQQLGYVLQYGTPGFPQERMRLKLGRQKTAIDSIRISYPDYFDGEFNEKSITIQESPKSRFIGFGRSKQIPISSAKVDKDSRLIEIVPAEPIPAGTAAEIVLSNVQNPRSGGIFYLNCFISVPGDVPLKRYLGTWVMSISRS